MTRTKWPNRPNYPPKRDGLLWPLVALVVMASLLVILSGCQTTKPLCPPPEVIVQKVPVVVPWPNVPVIPPPDLQTPSLEASKAPVNTLLLAIIHDLDNWRAYAQQLATALEVYRVQPPSPETPQKP